MIVRDKGYASYWGDLHGQSGETVGINPMREYLEFARDVAFLDVTSHQANDFRSQRLLATDQRADRRIQRG